MDSGIFLFSTCLVISDNLLFVRMTVQECGMSDAVLQTLATYLDRATDDIKVSFISCH